MNNIIEFQFLYAPIVNQHSVIVSTNDDDKQMSIQELKEQYPVFCKELIKLFS